MHIGLPLVQNQKLSVDVNVYECEYTNAKQWRLAVAKKQPIAG